MFNLAWPWLLLCLPLPLILRWLLPPADPSQSALRVPFFNQLDKLASQEPALRNRFSPRFWLPATIWILLVFAAARPQWLEPQKHLNIAGRNSMLAVDLSASMLVKDLEHSNISRFDATRELLLQLLASRPDDRFGLIFFASQAYLQAPLTFDHDSLRHWLERVEPGIAGDNTAIGDAIGLGIKRLRNLHASQKNLILLTDGANNSGIMPPRTAARFAAREGIRIHALGIGQAASNSQTGPDQALLQDITWLTGGRYLHIDSQQSLESAIRFFDSLPTAETETQASWQTQELYHWLLYAAFLAGMLYALFRLLQHIRASQQEPDHA